MGIESVEGEKVSVKLVESKEVKVFKQDQVGQVNPPKFDCSDDMAGLTYLNDACVLWNSCVRYYNQLIYTYSGLFCIAINPYIRFPIYTQRAMEIYMGLVRHDVVESVVASFNWSLESQTRFFQQVDDHVSTRELTTSIEPDTDEFTKSRGVVIPQGLGITPGLQDGVDLDNFVHKTNLALLLLASGTNGGKVRDDLLGVLSLASTRLTSNENRLVLAIVHHTLVLLLSNTKDMRWALAPPQAHVDLHGTLGVDGEANIGIDGNTEEARIGVDKLIVVPNTRVPQDTSIIQICQPSHIVGAVELGRVDLTNLVLLEDFDLFGLHELDGNLFTLNRFDETFQVSTSTLFRNPDRLFRVIRLRLELNLKLIRNIKPL